MSVRPPRASFIQQPRGKNNLLPVLMVGPAAPVWIGFRGHQSQAIRSKWSLCNTRQTAKSFRTKPRPPSCVCVYMCVLLQYPDPHSTLASVTGLILVYFWASDLADDPFILTSPRDSCTRKSLMSFIFFNQNKVSAGWATQQPEHISNPFIPLLRF